VRCFFCLEERPPSDEHVFPLAIGGKLVIDRVCRECNSTLGEKVDSKLTNHVFITMKREALGLAGNSGAVPTFVKHLKDGNLADDPNQRIKLIVNPKTGCIEPRMLFSVIETPIDDHTDLQTVFIDATDDVTPKKLEQIIQGQLKKAGMPPLPQDEIDRRVASILEAGPQKLEQPTIRTGFSVDLNAFRPALLKIAYELACLWLGETYLDDPMAANLRNCIFGRLTEKGSGIKGKIFMDDAASVFQPWFSGKNCHLAYSMVARNGICVALKVFDAFSAVITVTDDKARYLSNDYDPAAIRFIHIDTESGAMRQSSFIDEVERLARF